MITRKWKDTTRMLTLVPNKDRVIKDIFRVLKPGGHFSISDVVLIGNLPDGLRHSAEMYAGCISGAIQKEAYLELITQNGFQNISIQNEKVINIPADILRDHLSEDEVAQYQSKEAGIFSITVYAEKPLETKACCGPDCCN